MPFQKGQSGNPTGRPSPARKTLNELLDQHYTTKDRVASIKRLIELQAHTNPDVSIEAIKVLMAYAYGKPIERKELSGPGGEPLKAYIGVSPDAWDDSPGE
jgi:Family of unknown function (DUF5681)